MTRLNQFIAGATNLSRRAADAAIAAGRVTLDGHPATLGDQVEQGSVVKLDNHTVTPPTTRTYLLLHKPTGYVSSRTRQGSDPTIYDLLPDQYLHLRPAGRLDRDSSGLMLLSDDGDFIQRLTHPSHNKAKIYELTLSRSLTPADTARLENGVQLEDGPSHLRILTTTGPYVTVSLNEGRNRQLRRTFGALGYGVKRLHRISIGPYKLGDVAAGKFKLTASTQPH